jgi:hypothetical protein
MWLKLAKQNSIVFEKVSFSTIFVVRTSLMFHDLKNVKIARRSLKICQFWPIWPGPIFKLMFWNLHALGYNIKSTYGEQASTPPILRQRPRKRTRHTPRPPRLRALL